MTPSGEQIQALADAVAMWRTQEYIAITAYCIYVYHVLSTAIEEGSIILPQRWNRGKTLYAIIRYGTLVFIALQLSRDYRNYFVLSPKACKIVAIIYQVFRTIAGLACDFSLALCLGALLHVRPMYLVGIVILSCGTPFATALIVLVSEFQYPAEPISLLDAELGYPCYAASAVSVMEETLTFMGRDIRAYVNLVATTLLALLGVGTLVARYKGQGGGLVKVIRRDGGLHYLSLLAIRMMTAIIQTPAVIPVPEIGASPVFLFVGIADIVIIPIIAQRMLIDMRKVDYMGSEPVASKLLFAPPAPGSEEDLEGDFDAHEMAQEPFSLRHRGCAGKELERGDVAAQDNHS